MDRELVKILEGCIVEVRCNSDRADYYGLLAKTNERGIFLDPGASRGLIDDGSDKSFRQKLAEALSTRPMVFINWKCIGDVSGSDYTAEQLSIKRTEKGAEANLAAHSCY